jgi:hypothetical protein
VDLNDLSGEAHVPSPVLNFQDTGPRNSIRPGLDIPPRSTNVRKILRCRAQLFLEFGESINVRAVDIAPSGMSIMTPTILTMGTTCVISFDLPHQGALHTIRAAAKVIYCTRTDSDGFRLGISFSEPDPLRLRLISELH